MANLGISRILRYIPAQAYVWTAAATVLLAGYTMWAHQQREIGKRDLLIAQYERANATLRHTADSLAKAYKVDTVEFYRLKRLTDSVFVNVERWKTDTLKVVEYVVKADSTIKACTQALSTCEARVGVAQEGWKGARKEIGVLKAQIPTPLQKWRERAIWSVGGGLFAYYVVR